LVKGSNNLKGEIPIQLLNEGKYRVEMIVLLYSKEWIVKPERNAPHVGFEVRGSLNNSTFTIASRPGIFDPVLEWGVL
jgi:hypothetical protein